MMRLTRQSRLPRDRPLTVDSFRDLATNPRLPNPVEMSKRSSVAQKPLFRVPLPMDTYIVLWLCGQQLASYALVWRQATNACKHWENRTEISRERGRLRNGNKGILSRSYEYETKARLYRQQAYEANTRYWIQFDDLCDYATRTFGDKYCELICYFSQMSDYAQKRILNVYRGTSVFHYLLEINRQFASIEAKMPVNKKRRKVN